MDKGISIGRITFAPTPAKGQPMPQTREYWEKRAQTDQDLILRQRDEINQLKQVVNKLQQKITKSGK